MTTPPAHAAQTVDVSRATVEKVIRIAGCERWGAGWIGQSYFTVAAMLRALLDAKEKAEREGMERIERVVAAKYFYHKDNGDKFAPFLSQILDAIAREKNRTGNDDTGEMT